MSGKSFEVKCDNGEKVVQDEWKITELEEILLKRGLIPEFVRGDDALYDILLRQMLTQLVWSVEVPKRPQGPTFAYLSNCKQMLEDELYGNVADRTRKFEMKTGVNLDHYYRLANTKMSGEKRKQTLLDEQTELRKREKQGLLIFYIKIHRWFKLY